MSGRAFVPGDVLVNRSSEAKGVRVWLSIATARSGDGWATLFANKSGSVVASEFRFGDTLGSATRFINDAKRR